MPKIRTLIVDDEPLARERLRQLLAAEEDIEIVGESLTGAAAVADIADLRPDLVFLDIHMPEMDGFAVLEAIGPENAPAVVFVTAYDTHALRAFDVHALDYLVKPFDKERFQKALERGRRQIEKARSADAGQKLLALLDDVKKARKPADRLVIKSGGRVFFLRFDEIDWIEAAGNYVKLHVGAEDFLHRETLTSLESRLDPEQFLRIHRSTIVNVERIQEMQPAFHGDYEVILRNGVRLTMSRNYRPRLQQLFGNAI